MSDMSISAPNDRLTIIQRRAYSSAVERYVDIVEVPSSILGTPTTLRVARKSHFFEFLNFISNRSGLFKFQVSRFFKHFFL